MTWLLIAFAVGAVLGFALCVVWTGFSVTGILNNNFGR